MERRAAMVEREQGREKSGAPAVDRPADRSETLPYAVELWDNTSGEVKRVVARALNVAVARAIFKAAQTEYEGRRLTLRRRDRLIADSSR